MPSRRHSVSLVASACASCRTWIICSSVCRCPFKGKWIDLPVLGPILEPALAESPGKLAYTFNSPTDRPTCAIGVSIPAFALLDFVWDEVSKENYHPAFLRAIRPLIRSHLVKEIATIFTQHLVGASRLAAQPFPVFN